jgi:hypothetical protein
MKSIGDFIKVPTKPLLKKRGGIVGPLTEQRDIASKILNLPIARVGRMTKGWSVDQLYRLNKTAQGFTKNPPALWWLEYKKVKDKYGKKTVHKSDVRKVGEDGGSNIKEEGQKLLF